MQKAVTPIKLRRKSSPEPATANTAAVAPVSSDLPAAHQSTVGRDVYSGRERRSIHSSANTAGVKSPVSKSKSSKATNNARSARDGATAMKSKTDKSMTSAEEQASTSNASTSLPSSSVPAARTTTAVASSSMLSDLDSDSDESYLPAVSEAIRMLDLDSQVSLNSPEASATQATASSLKSGGSSSQTNSSSTGTGRLLNLCPGSSSSIMGSNWQGVGYCSSLLQQFVAKSQSGEPPPPPPVQLTKGARKCFMDEPVMASIGQPGSATGGASATSVVVVGEKGKGNSEQDNLCDVLVPMRGLDCHSSHVSPDSGIQSVSGSPFSVHSSPVHPSAQSNGSGQSLAQAAQQQHTLMISPCPPAATPSPPPSKAKRSRAGKRTYSLPAVSKSTPAAASASSAPVKSSRSSSRNSHRSKSQSKSKGKVKSKSKSKGSKRSSTSRSTARRPRSCRDTALTLSSGLGADSSFVQAIQRGLNDALRLTGLQPAPADKEGRTAHQSAVPSGKRTSKSRSRRGEASTKRSNANDSKKEKNKSKSKSGHRKAAIVASSVAFAPSTATENDPSTFRNEIAAHLHLLINKGAAVGASEVKSTSTVKAPVEGPTALPRHASDREKRKKKKKKHKKESGDRVTSPAPPSSSVDPIVKQGLEVLCKTLARCAISRSSVASAPNGSKLPYIFQCRKYLGVVSGSKRKKADDDACSIAPATKRKSKNKKIDSSSGASNGGSSTNSGEKETADLRNAAAGAAAAGVSVELLLPLKKRHHHLPAPESTSATQQAVVAPSAAKTDLSGANCQTADGKKESNREKTSHEPVLPTQPSTGHSTSQQLPLQPSNSRKRAAALSDSANETSTESVAGESSRTGKSRKKKIRGRKKAHPEPVVAREAAKIIDTKPVVAIDPAPVSKPQAPAANPPALVEVLPPNKTKKGRRRKAFNRTGFPSVKKKRKKLSPTPIPDGPMLTSEETVAEMQKPVVSVAPVGRPGRAKRPRLHAPTAAAVAKDDDSDIALPESVPTRRTIATTSAGSSESPSSDEMVVGAKSASAAAASATGTEDQSEPKKRQKRVPSWRKRFLTAGLFSSFFKQDDSLSGSNGPQGPSAPNPPAPSRVLTYDPDEHEHGLLPPPFHCEKWLRRRRNDFQLPYDLWWLHQHGKLPGRDTMVPSWNYRKIRTNVYYDVKPPFSNDAQACNCKHPQPNPDGSIQADAFCGDDCLNRMVYTECSTQLCPLADKCCNQRIQRHIWAQGLERFMTKEKGWGVRCRNRIKAGQFILEYVGEVVSDKEFKERMHTVYTKDTHHYCLHLDGGLVIDGHRMGGDGQYLVIDTVGFFTD